MFSFLIGSEENGSVAKACESQFVTCLRIPLLSTREGGEGWIVFSYARLKASIVSGVRSFYFIVIPLRYSCLHIQMSEKGW